MSQQKFEPTRFKNKTTVYVAVPNILGVSTIWDWSKRRKKYCKRSLGNKFYAIRRVDGKQVSKCFVHLVDAKNWQQGKVENITDESSELTFGELTRLYFEKKKNEVRISTFETYFSTAKHLKYFDHFRVSQIGPRTIDAWLEYLKRPLYLRLQHRSRVSYRHELASLRQILDYYAEYICEDNSYSLPIKKRHRKDCIVDQIKDDLAKAKSKRKFLPRSLIKQFISALRKNALSKPQHEVFSLVAIFQIGSGARIGEVCSVLWNDLDLDGCTAFIHRNVCWSRKKGRQTFVSPLTKTGEERTIFFPVALASELKKWALKSGRQTGLVFSFDGFKPLEYRAVQYHYDKALKSIGSDWTGTHVMRHSFSTDFLEKTQNPKALQGILGHRTARQTNEYAKITEGLMQKGMNEYNKSFSELANSAELATCWEAAGNGKPQN